jgi:hypothetical protein
MPSSVRVVNGGKLGSNTQAPVAALQSPISVRAGVADRSSHHINSIVSNSANALKPGKPAVRELREGHGRSSGHEARLNSNLVSD